MRIINDPWIAISIDTDGIRVAYPIPKQAEDSFEIGIAVPPEHDFDTVFHYSVAEKQWRFGADAWDYLEKDPAGFVAVRCSPIHWEQPIDFADGTSVRPSELMSRLLRHVREYCQNAFFDGMPIRSCVIAVQHRYNSIRTLYRHLAEEAGFGQVLFRDAMVAGTLLWKSEWQLGRPFVLTCNISDSRITTSLLKKNFQGFVKTSVRSHNSRFGADRIDEHLLARIGGDQPCPPEVRASELIRIRKFRLETMLKSAAKRCLIDIGGVKKPVESSHRIAAMKQFVADLYEELAPFLEIVSQKISIPLKEIPLVVLGMGHYDADLETLLQARFGQEMEWCYFWPHSEYAVSMGLALMLCPPTPPANILDEATRARVRWYTDAGQPGGERPQYRLARRLEEGRGICQVEEEAVDWLRLAAANGYPRAMFRLAYMIARDKGTDYDPVELETLLGNLQWRGYRMELFRQGVARFQEGREIEVGNQKAMNPSLIRRSRDLKKDAEEYFQRCRSQNGAFASNRQRLVPATATTVPPVLSISAQVPSVMTPPEILPDPTPTPALEVPLGPKPKFISIEKILFIIAFALLAIAGILLLFGSVTGKIP